VRVHGVADLPRLLPGADVVVLTVPLTDATRGLVDAAFLARMPDGALLVNVARGKVVDTDALLAELTSGRLRAALDVTDPEPLPADHPLWSAPGLILTPHEGGNTTATPRRMVALVQAQLDRLVAGDEPVNVVART
jgi:phosphoglycerate dehydrogenase-like enzyme